MLLTVTGGGPSTLDCYQMLRSIKTLSLRMDQHGKSALCVAKFLEGNKFVEKVSYPGLKSHRQHELNRRQSYGSSGIVSFWIKGRLKQANKFLNSLKLFQLAISFGTCQSLAQLPYVTANLEYQLRSNSILNFSYTMTHGNLSPEAKQIAGITENLISLSVGLEDAQDIVADLDQALKASQK